MDKINVYDKIMIENQKERKYDNYINLHLTDGLGMEFTACQVELMPEGALTSFTVCDTFGSGLHFWTTLYYSTRGVAGLKMWGGHTCPRRAQAYNGVCGWHPQRGLGQSSWSGG